MILPWALVLHTCGTTSQWTCPLPCSADRLTSLASGNQTV